jgi:hypothetical protein
MQSIRTSLDVNEISSGTGFAGRDLGVASPSAVEVNEENDGGV